MEVWNINNLGLGANNPLLQYLSPFLTQNQQPEQQPTEKETNRNSTGFNVYEINDNSDIEYIEHDKSGRLQVFICQNEKRIYTSRFNHVKKKPDYKAYIEEEEVKLFKGKEENEDISKIADALVAVVGKLESMEEKIQELSEKSVVTEVVKAEVISSNRDEKGRFVKKEAK